ncbi:hypothetical protein BgiBS90_030442 [Biomphalaria glabrata]|nr:hypothetical protein BgiBS90_030442 [Biomphalaria glabrata]
MESSPGALPVERLDIAVITSLSLEGSASEWFIGTCSMRAMASALMLDGQLRTVLECSAQRRSISSLSVRSFQQH